VHHQRGSPGQHFQGGGKDKLEVFEERQASSRGTAEICLLATLKWMGLFSFAPTIYLSDDFHC